MSDYASLKKTKAPRTLSVLLALLILLEICSLGVLASRVMTFSAQPTNRTISLTQGSAVKTGRRNADGSISWNEGSAMNRGFLTASILPGSRLFSVASARPYFKVSDDAKVWGTETEIEIFHIKYDETGSVTVQTCNNDKVFAPGTGNVYTYTVKNDESKGIDYTMYIEAKYEGTDKWIPIEAYLVDSDGRKLAGAADNYVDVLTLDGIVEPNKLAAGASRNYSLGWRWPFERTDGAGLDANDEYDTMLGDLAADNDLKLTIRISFIAEVDEDMPKTGDTSMTPWAIAAGASLVLIVVLLVVRKKQDKEEQ